MEKKHWAELLPEAGTIARSGQKQVWAKEKIDSLKLQIEQFEADYKNEENRIESIALKEWSNEEIEAAKKQTTI